MKKILIALSLVFLLSSFSKDLKPTLSYAIVFGGCFEKDKVTLKVNNVMLIDNYEIISDKMFRGNSNLGISQAGGKIQIRMNDKLIYKAAVKLKGHIVFDFLVNNKPYHYEVQLKNGRIFLVEFCNSKNVKGQSMTFEQRKTPVLVL